MTHEQFTQIYLPLCGKMYALAYNLLRDRNEARDCVQDVYAELWKNGRDSIEPDQTHVLKMVRDKCLARTGNNIERLCDTPTSDAPIVVVNIICEEHHYHEGAIHMEIHDNLLTN